MMQCGFPYSNQHFLGHTGDYAALIEDAGWEVSDLEFTGQVDTALDPDNGKSAEVLAQSLLRRFYQSGQCKALFDETLRQLTRAIDDRRGQLHRDDRKGDVK